MNWETILKEEPSEVDFNTSTLKNANEQMGNLIEPRHIKLLTEEMKRQNVLKLSRRQAIDIISTMKNMLDNPEEHFAYIIVKQMKDGN